MTSNYSVNDLDDFIQTEVLPPNARDAYEADLLDAFGGGGLSETRRGVIIVADRSWSVNRVMKAINAGLHNFCKDIANDPLSAGTVDVALVSFGTDVTVHNLRNGGSVESADYERDIDDIFVPASKVTGDLELKAGGLTSLNQALLTACELEGKYAYRVKEKTRKAPYKTVVVLLTDGHDEPGGRRVCGCRSHQRTGGVRQSAVPAVWLRRLFRGRVCRALPRRRHVVQAFGRQRQGYHRRL